MCIQRLRYAQEKQQALAKQDRREVAQLLADGKEQKAHYRVESLINDDIHIELLEILELYCELLHARVMILSSIENETALISEHMDDGINEAVRSIVFATLHSPEVKELAQMRDLLTLKFGPDFVKVILDDHVGVPDKVVKKCSPNLPKEDLVTLYLKEIARTYRVSYSQLTDSEEENEEEEEQQEEEEEEEEEKKAGGNIGREEKKKTKEANKNEGDDEKKPIVAVDNDDNFTEDVNHPISVRKPRKNSETLQKDLKIPKEIRKDVKVIRKKEGGEEDLDELKRRFAALRR